MKEPFVVDSHEQVLPAWVELSRQLEKPVRLVTLDCHTDTSLPLAGYCREFQFSDRADHWRQELSHYRSTKSTDRILSRIKNDEHILAAFDMNVLQDAVIVAHRTSDFDYYSEHKMIFRKIDNHSQAKTIAESGFDSVIESEFLSRKMAEVDQILTSHGQSKVFESDYILDIDLDYFRTHKSYQPIDKSLFCRLWEQASLVTIAKEPLYVQTCAIDEGLVCDDILEGIVCHI